MHAKSLKIFGCVAMLTGTLAHGAENYNGLKFMACSFLGSTVGKGVVIYPVLKAMLCSPVFNNISRLDHLPILRNTMVGCIVQGITGGILMNQIFKYQNPANQNNPKEWLLLTAIFGFGFAITGSLESIAWTYTHLSSAATISSLYTKLG